MCPVQFVPDVRDMLPCRQDITPPERECTWCSPLSYPTLILLHDLDCCGMQGSAFI